MAFDGRGFKRFLSEVNGVNVDLEQPSTLSSLAFWKSHTIFSSQRDQDGDNVGVNLQVVIQHKDTFEPVLFLLLTLFLS